MEKNGEKTNKTNTNSAKINELKKENTNYDLIKKANNESTYENKNNHFGKNVSEIQETNNVVKQDNVISLEYTVNDIKTMFPDKPHFLNSEIDILHKENNHTSENDTDLTKELSKSIHTDLTKELSKSNDTLSSCDSFDQIEMQQSNDYMRYKQAIREYFLNDKYSTNQSTNYIKADSLKKKSNDCFTNDNAGVIRSQSIYENQSMISTSNNNLLEKQTNSSISDNSPNSSHILADNQDDILSAQGSNATYNIRENSTLSKEKIDEQSIDTASSKKSIKPKAIKIFHKLKKEKTDSNTLLKPGSNSKQIKYRNTIKAINIGYDNSIYHLFVFSYMHIMNIIK